MYGRVFSAILPLSYPSVPYGFGGGGCGGALYPWPWCYGGLGYGNAFGGFQFSIRRVEVALV